MPASQRRAGGSPPTGTRLSGNSTGAMSTSLCVLAFQRDEVVSDQRPLLVHERHRSVQRHDGCDDAIGSRHRRVEPRLHERVEDTLEARRRDGHGAEAVARVSRINKLRRQHEEACKEELEEMQRQRRVAASRRDDRRKEGSDGRSGVDRDERPAVMIPVTKHRTQEIVVRLH